MSPDEAPAHTRDLGAVEDTIWAMLVGAVADRRAAFRLASLATTGADGWPDSRTVVLRQADRAARTVRFHTDRRSPKVAALAADPRCTMVFYDHAAKVQVRLKGRAALPGADAPAAALWRDLPAASRAPYAQAAAPSAPIRTPDAAEGSAPADETVGFANFISVLVHIESIDWLFLCARRHCRALICYEPSASRTWLAP